MNPLPVLTLLAFGAVFLTEASAMTTSELTWQGAAGRRPDRYLAVKVASVKAERRGLFGLGESASIEGAMPKARVMRGAALAGGETVRLRAPGAELPGLAAGDVVVLGLVGAGCICVLKPPASLAASALDGWARAQPCGS